METEEQTMCNRVKELLKLSRKSVETALNLVDLSNCALFFELRKAEDVLSSAEASFKSMMEMREEDRDEEDSKISRKRKSSCFDKRNLKMRKFEEDEQRIEDLIEHSEIFWEQEISKNDLTYDLILNDTNSSKDETVNTQNFAKNKVDKDIGLNSSKIKIESKQKSLANSELQKEQDNQCKIRSKISQLEERKCWSNFDTNSLINLTQNESSQASIKILDDIKCESLTSEDESSSQSLEEINEILSSQQESITQSDASNLKPKLNWNNILELKINKSALNFSDKFGQSQIKNKSSIIEKSTINWNNGNMKWNSLICSLCKTLIENDEFDISSWEHKIHSKWLITEISKRIKDFKTNVTILNF